jgi:hypothetical protein
MTRPDQPEDAMPMITVGAVSSRSSRTIHVAQVTDIASARGTWVRAACGQPVEVRGYEIDARHDVCRRCRKSMGWGTK